MPPSDRLCEHFSLDSTGCPTAEFDDIAASRLSIVRLIIGKPQDISRSMSSSVLICTSSTHRQAYVWAFLTQYHKTRHF